MADNVQDSYFIKGCVFHPHWHRRDDEVGDDEHGRLNQPPVEIDIVIQRGQDLLYL